MAAAARGSEQKSLAARTLRWAAERMRGGASAEPARPRLAPVRRRRTAAFREARRAVRSGVQLGEYLRFRLAHYLSTVAVPASELPITLALEDGELLDTGRPGRPMRSPAPAHVAGESPPAVRRDVEAAEDEIDRLDARIESQEAHVAQLERALEAAIAQGAAAPQGLEALAPEQAGRPRVPPPWALGVCGSVAALLVLAETWQLASRFLAAGGIAIARLPAEWPAHALEVAFGVLLALGVALALVVAAQLALRDVLESWERARREARVASAVAAAAILGAASVWSVLAARPGPSGPEDRWAFGLFALLVPFAVAWLVRLAASLRAERLALLAKARAWDDDYLTVLAERSRREELVQRAAQERDRLRAERDAARERLARLRRRAEQGDIATAVDPAELLRVASSLHAALELDRFAFVREASRKGARALLGTSGARPLLPAPVEPGTPPIRVA